MKKSFLWLVVAFIIILSSSYTFSFAAAYEDKDIFSINSSLYIDSYSAAITASSGGKIEIVCAVTGIGIMDVIGVSTLNIQKYQAGSWTTVKSWSGLYDYNSMQAAFHATYQGIAGSQYRAVIIFYASNSVGSDTRILTTNSVTAIN